MKEENYLDSRTKEEREKDSKIESITTTSEQLKQKAGEEVEEWEENFDCEFIEKDSDEEYLRNEVIKSFIRRLLASQEEKLRQEIKKDLLKKLPKLYLPTSCERKIRELLESI